ncbi:MAG: ATP-grasp domain-containing protein [Ruminococcaceae bacterium]|nr:ATP-grasp domain-containing protein [Oscillospiraceae bacterium]
MDFKGTRVLVLDGFGRQVAIILKELHDLGCVCTTLNCSKMDVGYVSRYPVKKILEPQTRYDMAELKKVLDREIFSGNYDVVMPMTEPTTDTLWENKDLYLPYVKYACADEECFVKAYDKQLTMELCTKNGINCPITKMDDESMDEFLAKVKFPLALKPRKGSGSRGFYKAETKERLFELINSGAVKVDEYVIQEFIENAETHRVSYTFIDNDGEVKTSMIAKSSMPYPLGVGTNSLFQSCNMPEVALQAEKLLKLMNWRGYASVCFIESEEDHIPKVMEINGRISASLKISWYCGAHVVRQMLERAYGVPVTSYIKDYPDGLRIRHWQATAMWFVKSPDRFKTKPFCFTPFKTKDVVFSLSDPLPWFAYTISCFARYKGEMEKRKR